MWFLWVGEGWRSRLSSFSLVSDDDGGEEEEGGDEEGMGAMRKRRCIKCPDWKLKDSPSSM